MNKKYKERNKYREYLVNKTIMALALFLFMWVSAGFIQSKTTETFVSQFIALSIISFFILAYIFDRLMKKKGHSKDSTYFYYVDRYGGLFFAAYLGVIVLITLLFLALMGKCNTVLLMSSCLLIRICESRVENKCP